MIIVEGKFYSGANATIIFANLPGKRIFYNLFFYQWGDAKMSFDPDAKYSRSGSDQGPCMLKYG